ncbi:hypothetical protein G9A89_014718 [Geosiphon pyriformis]|nr:hypothetical protein G9A89_014718 [Geosiphon pyriformis]
MEGYKLPMTVISTMASQSWRLEPVYVKEEYKRIAKELRNINSQNISSNKGVKESRSLKNNQKKQDKSGLKRNQILTLSKNFESELCEKETLKFRNFLSSKTLEKIKYINLLTAEQGKNKKLKETSDNVKRINHEFGSRMVEIADISFKNNLRRRAEIANYGYCDNQNEIGKAVKDQDIVADIWEESIKKKELVVYFRGAKLSKEQWINRPFNVSSTNIVTRQPLNSMVDSIWLKHVQLMIPLLNGKLKKLTNQPESIDFVGHGIGGVYAVLAALYFKHVGLVECFPSYRRFKPIIIGIYTFGTPRFGNLDLVRLVNASFQKKKIVRVTQQNDWVSRDFSPKGWFLHYESEYWVGYAKDDCGCIIIPKRETLYRCLGRGPRGQIDENVECNLGTVDDDNIKELNQRSYFGIDFGKC